MGLPEAIAIAASLRDQLAREVDRARGEREHLKNLDSPAIFRGAESRAEFNAAAAQLQQELADQLAAVAKERGLSAGHARGPRWFRPVGRLCAVPDFC